MTWAGQHYGKQGRCLLLVVGRGAQRVDCLLVHCHRRGQAHLQTARHLLSVRMQRVLMQTRESPSRDAADHKPSQPRLVGQASVIWCPRAWDHVQQRDPIGCKRTRQRGQWVIRTWSKCHGEARVSTMLAPTLTLRVWRRLPLEPPDSPGDQWDTAVRGESEPWPVSSCNIPWPRCESMKPIGMTHTSRCRSWQTLTPWLCSAISQ
jgi:hypothetical protein